MCFPDEEESNTKSITFIVSSLHSPTTAGRECKSCQKRETRSTSGSNFRWRKEGRKQEKKSVDSFAARRQFVRGKVKKSFCDRKLNG